LCVLAALVLAQGVFLSDAPAAHAQGPAPTPTAQLWDAAQIEKMFANVQLDYPFPAQVRAQTGPEGAAIQLGYLIMVDTPKYAGEYVGDNLTCENCHLSAGSLPYAAPLWGAFPNYPAYRAKNELVNTYATRLQGCFVNSMNGQAPPADDKVIVALTAYSAWLAQGAPTGVTLQGRGFKELPNLAPNVERGAQLYADQCALCHGADGQGTRARDGTGYVFPPLWGGDGFAQWLGPEGEGENPYVDANGAVSFNWGAGLANVQSFAEFVQANMPLGQGGTLSAQDAIDIAAWVLQDAHERPV
jgi:thiosulfate dehydrogenase